jgi:molybdopterin-binding protein
MAVYRGTVVSFDSGTWKAKVRLDGSPAQVLDSVATNRGIASADMSAGRKVLVDTGDHNHPSDFVVTTVWA